MSTAEVTTIDRGSDYLRGYTDALDHAAAYVDEHCVDGAQHADVVRKLKQPSGVQEVLNVLRDHHQNCGFAAMPDQPANCSCPPRGVSAGCTFPDCSCAEPMKCCAAGVALPRNEQQE